MIDRFSCLYLWFRWTSWLELSRKDQVTPVVGRSRTSAFVSRNVAFNYLLRRKKIACAAKTNSICFFLSFLHDTVRLCLFFPVEQHNNSIRVFRLVFKWWLYKWLYKSISLKCCWNAPPPHFLATAHRKVLQSAVELEWSSDTIQQPQILLIGTHNTATNMNIFQKISNTYFISGGLCQRSSKTFHSDHVEWGDVSRLRWFSCPLSAANHLCCHSWTRKCIAQSWPSSIAYANHLAFYDRPVYLVAAEPRTCSRERLRCMHSLFMSECFMCTKQTVVTGIRPCDSAIWERWITHVHSGVLVR